VASVIDFAASPMVGDDGKVAKGRVTVSPVDRVHGP
jgi:hypothetical protein